MLIWKAVATNSMIIIIFWSSPITGWRRLRVRGRELASPRVRGGVHSPSPGANIIISTRPKPKLELASMMCPISKVKVLQQFFFPSNNSSSTRDSIEGTTRWSLNKKIKMNFVPSSFLPTQAQHLLGHRLSQLSDQVLTIWRDCKVAKLLVVVSS